MKNEKIVIGKLVLTGRLNSSINGNPRYQGYIETFETNFDKQWLVKNNFITAPDSMLAYQITNFEGKQVRVVVGDYYNKKTIKSLELI